MIESTPQTVLNKSKIDKFVLIITTPPILLNELTRSERGKDFLNQDTMQYSVAGITLPTHTISEIPMSFMGQTMHITSQTRSRYPTSKVKFTIDNRYSNYFYLWKWLYILNNPDTSGMDSRFAEFDNDPQKVMDAMRKDSKGNPIRYKEIKMQKPYDAYQTTMTLYAKDEYNVNIIKFDYKHAFITQLGGFDYDYQNSDDIPCSFDFAYGQVDITLIDPP